nr:MAG TPA: hypothetical protein [Caudoviricetes sp.]
MRVALSLHPCPSYLLCFCKLRTLNLALSYHQWKDMSTLIFKFS